MPWLERMYDAMAWAGDATARRYGCRHGSNGCFMPWLRRMDDVTARSYGRRHGLEVWMTPRLRRMKLWLARWMKPWLRRMGDALMVDATASTDGRRHDYNGWTMPWLSRMEDRRLQRMDDTTALIDV